MKHRELQRRVQAAERCLAERLAESRGHVASLKHDTREAVTPLRIIGGGLLGGFTMGLAAPLSRLGGIASLPKLLQLGTSVVSFVNAFRIQQAAEQTQEAAEDVSDASQRIDETV